MECVRILTSYFAGYFYINMNSRYFRRKLCSFYARLIGNSWSRSGCNVSDNKGSKVRTQFVSHQKKFMSNNSQQVLIGGILPRSYVVTSSVRQGSLLDAPCYVYQSPRAPHSCFADSSKFYSSYTLVIYNTLNCLGE